MTARNAWAAVVLVVASLASVTILAVTHAATSDLLTIISAAVVPTATMLLVGGHISGQVADVKSQVNGRMGELIAANAAQTAASTSTPVIVNVPSLNTATADMQTEGSAAL